MSNAFKRGSLVLLATAALALTGCATPKEGGCCDDSGAKKATAAPATAAPAGRVMVVNTICPLSGEDFDSKDRSTEVVSTYNGENIGFCCPGCVKKFDKMTDAKKAQVLTAAKSNVKM